MNLLHRFAARSQQWPRELLTWLGKARFLWLTLLLPPVLAVLAWCALPPEKGRKLAATVLEVSGLFAVGAGLLKTQQRFDPRGRDLRSRTLDYFSRFPPPRGRKPITGDSAEVLEGAEMRASAGAVRPRQDPLEVLRDEVRTLQGDVSNLSNKLAALETSLTQEQQERQKDIERTKQQVVELAVGDLPTQFVGWLWLVAAALLHGFI